MTSQATFLLYLS